MAHCHLRYGEHLSAFPEVPIVRNLNISCGQEATFNAESIVNVQRCEVLNNRGEEFTVYPAKNIPENLYYNGNRFKRTCTTSIRYVTVEDAGWWIIKVYPDNTTDISSGDYTILKYGLHVEQETNIIPSKMIRVFPGYSVSARVSEGFVNLTSCIVTDPTGEEIDILRDERENPKLYGQCGVRLTINDNHNGEWKIVAWLGNFISYVGRFDVLVQKENLISVEKNITLYLQNGIASTITVGPSDATFSQFEKPNGQLLPIKSSPCRYDIPIVRYNHMGIWICRYAVQGKVNLTESKVNVITYEDRALNVSVTTGDNGEINLLCKIRSNSVRFCRFTRPDGTSFHMSPGVGNDRYMYYGEGFQSSRMFVENIHDCGLSITQPNYEDYGAWTCTAENGNGNIVGSIIRVHDGMNKNTIKVQPAKSEVYVKRGDSFVIKCSVDSVLSYCWLRSPNGTAYAISESGSGPSFLRYTGSGLALGECGAVIEVAEDSHSGEWSCRMGLVSEAELHAKVTVTVTKSLIIADWSKTKVDHTGIWLTCRTLPGHESSIDFCRWIRPDGYGIFNNIEPRYYVEQTATSCSIYTKATFEEDIGQWTCVASLTEVNPKEVWTHINVRYEYTLVYKNVTMLIIALAFLMVISLFVFIVIMCIKRAPSTLSKKLEKQRDTTDPTNHSFSTEWPNKFDQYNSQN
ncbi:uncharacterized protein LOC107270452 isoform X2 [Cephus cinctus]|uniref:Uncharacterized protein LOC107270452 isoform X2 n=1 Tax=Cephus cinctus TaxID=211228 RepID=A0AAJ7RNJ2_CEPCN|nr:uncharacterized protein LOC107270452 isoform X2 [Cephus cinctus]